MTATTPDRLAVVQIVGADNPRRLRPPPRSRAATIAPKPMFGYNPVAAVLAGRTAQECVCVDLGMGSSWARKTRGATSNGHEAAAACGDP